MAFTLLPCCRADIVVLLSVAEKTDVQEGGGTSVRSHSYEWLDLNLGLTLKPLCYMFLALKVTLGGR